MPLRSVEAASREDAIAAAREQFGPSARVIGVRRVRSGGVLGFFTTERYVAEVEPGPVRRSIGMPNREDDDDRDGGYDRFGHDARETRSSREGNVAARAAQLAAYLQQQESEQRVEEIAELFSGGPDEAGGPTYNRASFQRAVAAGQAAANPLEAQSAPPNPFAAALAARAPSAPAAGSPSASFPPAPASFPTVQASVPVPPEEPPAPAVDYPRLDLASALRKAAEAPAQATPPPPAPVLRNEPDEPSAPSPFTAALARMVAGDREVRQAVQDALDSQLAGDAGPAERPWTAGSPRVEQSDTRTGAEHQSTGAQHQEEKPVSQLETATGPSPAGQTLPNWAEAPSPATASREDEIAQILRTALAQNHSDDALADILRKVLADTSTAPAAASAPPAVPETEPVPMQAPAAWDEPAAEPLWAPAPAATAWPVETAQPTTPVAFVEAVRSYTEVPDDVVVPIDLGVPAPAPAPMPTAPFLVSMAPAVTVETAVETAVEEHAPLAPPAPLAEIAADEPIWAEVVLHEPAPTQEAPAVPAAPAQPVLAPMSPAAATLAQAIRAQILGEAPAPEQAAAEPVEAPVEAAVEAPVQVSVEPPVQVSVEPAIEQVPLQAEPVPAQVVADVDESVAETPEEPLVAEEPVAAESVHFAVSELARTASDPAPLPADATTVMPALSLLPPLPGARRGSRPPVPPPSRPAAPAADPATEEPAEAPEGLATVTMLPVVAVAEPDAAVDAIDEIAADAAPDQIDDVADDVAIDQVQAQNLDAFACIAEIDEPAPTVEEYVAAMEAFLEPAVAVPTAQPRAAVPPVTAGQSGDVVSRLRALGIPEHVLGAEFAADAEVRGTYAALTASMSRRLPEAPVLPTGAGDVLFIVGPGVATLRAARSLAASVGLHPDCVQWASRGELAGLAPKNFRMSTIEDALDRRQEVVGCGTVTIVAVDAPLRTDAYWIGQMLAVWTPAAVWAVAEATRKPEDLGEWLDELPRVDALVLQDTDLSADPAAVLEHVSMPVALLDGVRATPHRWASLLCERLESGRA